MLFSRIIMMVLLHPVFSYYFYNPQTQHVLTASTLSNIPDGYKLITPPRSRRPSFRRDKQINNGECSDPGFICSTPYHISSTYQLECSKDYQCPNSYKCCHHKCFVHKICIKNTSPQPKSHRRGHNSSPEKQGTCEKWPYNCPTPYQYSLTSMFKCENDRHCPTSFKCCSQSCFQHKICSRAIPKNEGYVEEIRKKEDEGNDSVLTSTTKITTMENEQTTTETEQTTTEIAKTKIITETEQLINDAETTSSRTTQQVTNEADEEVDPTTVAVTTSVSTNSPEDTNPTQDITTKPITESDVEATEQLHDEADFITSNYTDMKEEGYNTTSQYSATEKRRPPTRTTPDPNAIIPEYEEYYYNYQYPTDKEQDEYSEDE